MNAPTVPTNNEEAEALNLLKYAAGVDHPTFGQGFFFTQAAVDSLISDARRLPVSGDNAELIAEATRYADAEMALYHESIIPGAKPDVTHADNASLIGDLIAALSASQPREAALTEQGRKNARLLGDWLAKHYPSGEPDIAVVALTVLKALHEADKPREAAPSDTDRLHDDIDGWLENVPDGRCPGAYVAEQVASRTPHPVQVEVSDDTEWGVYSEREGNFYHVQPPTYENAVHEAELVGEAHRPVPKELGAELSNAWSHGRHAALGGGDHAAE